MAWRITATMLRPKTNANPRRLSHDSSASRARMATMTLIARMMIDTGAGQVIVVFVYLR
jgi:hypothetical protein